jgi:hypothetical protein
MHTHEYFMSECHAFLTLLGSRTFWKLPFENREGALTGLTHVYFGVSESTEDQERQRVLAMQLALDDYNRRSVYTVLNP